jgi:hypothetical protein
MPKGGIRSLTGKVLAAVTGSLVKTASTSRPVRGTRICDADNLGASWIKPNESRQGKLERQTNCYVRGWPQ